MGHVYVKKIWSFNRIIIFHLLLLYLFCVCLIITARCDAPPQQESQQLEDLLDSNKVLTDFIWTKIIAANSGKHSSSSLNSSMLNKEKRAKIPIVTIPYAKHIASSKSSKSLKLLKSSTKSLSKSSSIFSPPSSSSSSSSSPWLKSSLSRRSSFSSILPTASSSLPSSSASSSSQASSNSYATEQPAPKNHQNSIANKYLADSTQSSASTSDGSPPIPVKTSFFQYHIDTTHKIVSPSQREAEKSFLLSVFRPQQTAKSSPDNTMAAVATSASSTKSVYDLIPMPTYGSLPKYSDDGGYRSSSSNNHNHNNNNNYDQNSGNNNFDKPNMYHATRTLEIMPIMPTENNNNYNNNNNNNNKNALAIAQQPYIQYREPTPSTDNNLSEPKIIEVMPDQEPIEVIFRSTTTPVQVRQVHTPLKPEPVEQTKTEEEPHRVTHQLVRPVIQEVFEIIQPYRKVTQEIRPVLEQIHTVVSKGMPRNNGNELMQQQQQQRQQARRQKQQRQSQQSQSQPEYQHAASFTLSKHYSNRHHNNHNNNNNNRYHHGGGDDDDVEDESVSIENEHYNRNQNHNRNRNHNHNHHHHHHYQQRSELMSDNDSYGRRSTTFYDPDQSSSRRSGSGFRTTGGGGGGAAKY